MNSPTKKRTLFEMDDELSDREKDVVRLICQECTNNEIAEKLYISPRTVESHRQRIVEKIGAKNTVGIVIYAIINNIHPLKESDSVEIRNFLFGTFYSIIPVFSSLLWSVHIISASFLIMKTR
jgi:DNA-binding CsgD family transcriptional regulator